IAGEPRQPRRASYGCGNRSADLYRWFRSAASADNAAVLASAPAAHVGQRGYHAPEGAGRASTQAQPSILWSWRCLDAASEGGPTRTPEGFSHAATRRAVRRKHALLCRAAPFRSAAQAARAHATAAGLRHGAVDARLVACERGGAGEKLRQGRSPYL